MRTKRPEREQSIVAILRSGPFVVMLVACVLLGVAAIGRVWHENRNKLLQAQVRSLQRESSALREQWQVLRTQRDHQLSPQAIEERLRFFGLDLAQPSEEQILRVIEPLWERGTGGEKGPGPGPRRTREPNGVRVAEDGRAR